jgi:hypothetical protein
MPNPDPPDGYSSPDLPDADGYTAADLPAGDIGSAPGLPVEGDGYSAPNLPEGGGISASEGVKPGAAQQRGPETAAPGRPGFAMKPLGEEYQQGERNNAAATVTIRGEQTEVHEKDWLRQQTDAKRAAEGKPAVTDQMWKDNVATTQYMNDSQRAEHKVGFEPGVDATGAANAQVIGGGIEKARDHIFVMDGQGDLYAKEAGAALRQRDDTGRGVHVHHSSFLAGEDVAGAGELEVGRDGFVKGVTDRSGHYKPGEEQTSQTLSELENKGVNLDNVKFTMDRGQEKTSGMAKEYQQGGEQVFKARHNVADELKQKGASVKETLDKDAARRATRVGKLDGYLDKVEQGKLSYEDVKNAAEAHAAKDATALDTTGKAALSEQLKGQKEDLQKGRKPSVKDTLGGDPTQQQSQRKTHSHRLP